jgi:ADP-ribosylglycohydrolase
VPVVLAAVAHRPSAMTPIERARLALEGVAVGDTFGETFFGDTDQVVARIEKRQLSAPPWTYTDDTEMAISIFEMLAERGSIQQDDLALRFARRMQPGRGYGQGAYAVLGGILEGRHWRPVSAIGFRGMGSFGNGAAMRAAPLGAYFADEPLETITMQARLSAEITHAHAEGIAGGIAVAVAAALAWRDRRSAELGSAWLKEVRDAVPTAYTREAIDEAIALAPDAGIVDAAGTLGNGSGVTAPDTVPLCLWVCAHRGLRFDEALWTTVSAPGDRDTTCAIVGGILALRAGYAGIPAEWRQARERVPVLDEE